MRLFSYGRGSNSFEQRRLKLEKLERCDFNWVSTRGINANDKVHPKHKCKVTHMRHTANHRCNCGASINAH